MGIVNERFVKRAFRRAATTYDAHAVLQREVAERLMAHVRCARLQPRNILDIGCGTGYFTNLLRKQYRSATIVAVDLAFEMTCMAKARMKRWPWQGRNIFLVGDARHLPFGDASFDLVCSNLTMQWVSDPLGMLQEIRRVLTPGGLMAFSTFGRRTLSELRTVLSEIRSDYQRLVLSFPDVTELGDVLLRMPVEVPVADTDVLTLTFPNVEALVRELKGLGASAGGIANRPQGLYGRALLRRLKERYEARFSRDGRIYATFEVLYGQAWARP